MVERLREHLADDPDVAEISMFGVYCFTLRGNMLVEGASWRLQINDASAFSGASAIFMGERLMNGYFVVQPEALSGAALAE